MNKHNGKRSAWRMTVLLLGLGIGAVGCQPVHEPWTNNTKAWKEQHFRSNVPNQELQERIMTTQTDR